MSFHLSKPNCRRFFFPLSLVLFSAVLLSMLFPGTAQAAGLFPDIGAIVNDLIVNQLMKPIVESALQFFATCVSNLTVGGVLTASFSDIYGSSNGGTSLYDLVKTVHSTVVIPLGHSILALVMLVQVVKISQRIDATSTLPAVKDILFLAVFFVLFTWLINNSADICIAVYDTVVKLIGAIGVASTQSITITLGDSTNLTVGGMFTLLLIAVISALVVFIAWIIAFVMTYFRAIQLYLYTTFSPIPFALMGFEETRSFGVNFCRNFIAVCLAGAVMAFGLVAYPILIASVIADAQPVLSGLLEAGTNAEGAIMFVKVLALSIVLIFVLIKSGSIARDILGG